jgi:hypothetical protein
VCRRPATPFKSVWKRDKIQSLVSAGRIFERFDQGSPKLGRPVQAAKPTAFPNAKPAGGGPAGQNTIRIYFASFTPTRRKCQGYLLYVNKTRNGRWQDQVALGKRFAEHTATALEDESVTLRSASTALNERSTGFAAAGREMTWLPELNSAGRPASASVACAPSYSDCQSLAFELPDGRCCAPSSD